MNTIGIRLRFIRGNLTKTQLAQILNIKPPTIDKYENNIIIPSPKVLLKLVNHFNINLHWLFTGQGEPYYNIQNNDKPSNINNIEINNAYYLNKYETFNVILKKIKSKPIKKMLVFKNLIIFIFEKDKKKKNNLDKKN